MLKNRWTEEGDTRLTEDQDREERRERYERENH